jgi:hypothetical protein
LDIAAAIPTVVAHYAVPRRVPGPAVLMPSHVEQPGH